MEFHRMPLVNTDWCAEADIVEGVNFVHFRILNPAYADVVTDSETISHESFVRLGTGTIDDLAQRFIEEASGLETEVHLETTGTLRVDLKAREMVVSTRKGNGTYPVRNFFTGTVISIQGKPLMADMDTEGWAFNEIFEYLVLYPNGPARPLYNPVLALNRFPPSVIYGVHPLKFDATPVRTTRFNFVEMEGGFYAAPELPARHEILAYSTGLKGRVYLANPAGGFFRLEDKKAKKSRKKIPPKSHLKKMKPWIYMGSNQRMLEEFTEKGYEIGFTSSSTA